MENRKQRQESLSREKQNQNTRVLFRDDVHLGGQNWKGESRHSPRCMAWWQFLVISSQYPISFSNSSFPQFFCFVFPGNQVCLSVCTSYKTWCLLPLTSQRARSSTPPPPALGAVWHDMGPTWLAGLSLLDVDVVGAQGCEEHSCGCACNEAFPVVRWLLRSPQPAPLRFYSYLFQALTLAFLVLQAPTRLSVNFLLVQWDKVSFFCLQLRTVTDRA